MASAAWLLSCSSTAQACTFTITPGDDVVTCTSGAGGNLIDAQGNNSLIFPSGNGSVLGVGYGAGNDLIEMNTADAVIGTSGVNMGDGANIFRLFQGAVNSVILQGSGADVVQISGGTAGGIFQGAGLDKFSMSGGTITSLAQGDGIDDFAMSGGTITGAFEDGDHGLMTGGSIGRVDMKLDNNLFDMRGGTVVGNFVTGFGDDTILVSGTSFIGGNLSVSGGSDIIVIKGGRIAGEIRMSGE